MEITIKNAKCNFPPQANVFDVKSNNTSGDNFYLILTKCRKYGIKSHMGGRDVCGKRTTGFEPSA